MITLRYLLPAIEGGHQNRTGFNSKEKEYIGIMDKITQSLEIY
jgi:hypothetical protein